MEAFADLDKNETFFVLTGDIAGYTKIAPAYRESLMLGLDRLIKSFPEAKDAQTFRGDSFQILFADPLAALMRSIQIRCWLKKNRIAGNKMLDARIAVGAGTIDFFGKDILISDGEALQLSGRALDSMKGEEFLKVVCPHKNLNEFFEVICIVMEGRISRWTPSQAAVIFGVLEGKTQQRLANEHGVVQSAITNRLKLAYWKDFERTLRYIAARMMEM